MKKAGLPSPLQAPPRALQTDFSPRPLRDTGREATFALSLAVFEAGSSTLARDLIV